LPFNYTQYDGVAAENGDRIATTDMWCHFTLYTAGSSTPEWQTVASCRWKKQSV